MKIERRKRPGLPPIYIQAAVAERDLGNDLWPLIAAADVVVTTEDLAATLNRLASKIGCAVDDLQLDHTWLLRDRAYKPRKGKPVASWYTPHAHDPGYLRWRSKRREDEGSHAIKTYVRGDYGQLSDVALAKRARRREKNPTKWTELRGLKKPKRPTSRSKKSTRPIRSRGFPPKGSRPFNRRKPNR